MNFDIFAPIDVFGEKIQPTFCSFLTADFFKYNVMCSALF